MLNNDLFIATIKFICKFLISIHKVKPGLNPGFKMALWMARVW